jgi:glycosyltransferase involved in cell wall biosynthesis
MGNIFPIISVITPSFNSGKYLEQAIRSVLAQNYPDFEHIVVDGGSTDGTLEILKKYPHLKWISEPDKGQSHAMNKGFAMSTGDIIVYLNADDYFEPEAFNTVIKYFDKEKGNYIVVGDCNVIDVSGRSSIIKDIKISFFEMLQWWRYSFPYNPSSYFYYREVQAKVGPFDETNQYSMDYDFLLRAALHYNFCKINTTLGNFRFIEGTKTHDYSSKNPQVVNKTVSKKYWKHLSISDGLRIRLLYLKYWAWRFKLKCMNAGLNIYKQLLSREG